MASSKAKISPYTPALVIAIVVAALFGFQMLRDRSTLAAALKQRDSEIASLHQELNNVHKEMLEQQQAISQLTGEKVRLATDTDGLKSMLEKFKGSNDDNKQVLEDSLRSKDDELDDLKEQLAKLEHSKENVEELRQQVRELEKKLKVQAGAAADDDVADGDEKDESSSSEGGSGNSADERDDEINLDKDSVDDEGEAKQISLDETAEDDLIDKNEHSDDGEQE